MSKIEKMGRRDTEINMWSLKKNKETKVPN
jgi:hypothetical protein